MSTETKQIALPVQQILLNDEETVICPVCANTYNHILGPRVVDSQDDYKAGWWGRGDLTVISMRGECGSSWEICLGFHKGETNLFVRVLKPCPKLELQPETAYTKVPWKS